MSRRIAAAFERARTEGRAALIPFIMGGDPDMATAAAILAELPAAGADIIEIGMPFSDPMADGPVIQAAGLRALASGAHVETILGMVARFREKNNHTPIILMGYYNPVFRMGAANFCQRAAKAGVDGVILVDLPPEEEAEFTASAKEAGLSFIRLIAPTSGEQRLKSLVQSASGFVYYISVTGITGAQSAEISALQASVAQLKGATTLPIAVGFGIKTPERAAQVGAFADAVVVGSALVEIIGNAPKQEAPARAGAFVSSLAAGLKRKDRAFSI